jgi:hypothetical protein
MKILSTSYKKWLLLFISIFIQLIVVAQSSDSLDNIRLSKLVTLSEVVIRSNLDLSKFLARVKDDTSFYKAFRTLHVIGFTSWNDIRFRDKKGNVTASLLSKTKQLRNGNCRSMDVLQEKTTGDFYTARHEYNYNTAEMYAGLFFTKSTVCGENNVVRGRSFQPTNKSGMEKHKEQLKMLFFNPGKRIPGIPFIGDKIDIFDPAHAKLYDFSLDYGDHEGRSCYIFTIKAKENLGWFGGNKVVIDNMVTWFDTKTMEVVARNYAMKYDAGVYDFDVKMEVEMTHAKGMLVPKTLRYIGNWDVAFKKRERAVFTATLFDFN